MNTFLLMISTIGAACWLAWAIAADRADAHTIHTSGCVDCAADDERLGL